ncbi:MAG: Type 1 glutamine amidotransferase-like domain-containing protein [Actinomycetota bacterium]
MSAPDGWQDLVDRIPHGAGAIGLLSSDEYTPDVLEFDRALLARARGGARPKNIALILCADHRAASLNARNAATYFQALGARAFPLEIEHGPRARATTPIPDFDVIYIGGGSPSQLLGCMRDSSVWETVLERWRAGAVLAGASAGAMALSMHCQVPRAGDRVPTQWTAGLGPISNIAFAVHATSRSRAWLQESAKTAPLPLLCIEDKTGVVLTVNSSAQVVGSGRVWVMKPTP